MQEKLSLKPSKTVVFKRFWNDLGAFLSCLTRYSVYVIGSTYIYGKRQILRVFYVIRQKNYDTFSYKSNLKCFIVIQLCDRMKFTRRIIK